MGTTGAIILAVLIVAWQIISAMIQQSAKRQEEQRLRNLAARQREQGAGALQSSPTGQATGLRPPSQSASPQARGPLGATARDELAARREAQLEELRRRRQRQVGGASVRAGSPPPPPPKPLARPEIADLGIGGPIPVAGSRSTSDLWRAEQERQVQDKRQTAQKRTQKAEARRQQAEREVYADAQATAQREHVRVQLERTMRAEQAEEASLLGPRLTREKGMTSAQRLREMVAQRYSLRDIFMMKELLEKPITERELGAGQVPTD